jgi:hypothetical protein
MPPIQFFYDPKGGALCQNQKGLTFYLQGQPPARPKPSEETPAPWPTYPGQDKGAPRRGA